MLNPIHHHCGPFNTVKEEGDGPVDEICRQHDIAYGEYGQKAYIYFNKADEVFIKQMDKQGGLLPKVYSGYFKIKKAVAPVLPEKKMEYMPTPPMTGKKRRTSLSGTEKPKKLRLDEASSSGKKMPKAKSKKRLPRKVQLAKLKGKKVIRRRVRRSKLKGKKWPKKRLTQESRYIKKGYVITTEVGGITEGDQCVYFGHGTSPGNRLLKTVSYALIKALFSKAKLFVLDFGQTIGIGTTASSNDSFKVRLVSEHQVSGVLTNIDKELLLGTSYSEVAEWLYGQLVDHSYITANEVYRLARLELTGTGGQVPLIKLAAINLINCTVHLKSESSMKYQNRSYTADGLGDDDNAANVDRIPLIGKQYYSKGSKFDYKGSLLPSNAATATPFAVEENFGYLIKYDNNTDTRLKEPPHPKIFSATKAKSCSLVPGGVYKDFIKKSLKMRFTRLMYLMNANNYTGNGYQQRTYTWNARYGVVTMFGLEKAIHCDSNKVRVAYELNQKHMCYISSYDTQDTVPDFVQGGTAGVLSNPA